MKVIILAAGIGSRVNNPRPKSLTILKNGLTILQNQIKNRTKQYVNENFNYVLFKKRAKEVLLI